MKLLYLFLVATVLSTSNVASDGLDSFQKSDQVTYAVEEGDIIFQTTSGDLSKAIQLATHSDYSHCGIIFFDNGEPYVYEAVQPVQKIALDTWIERGVNSSFVVKRIINRRIMTKEAVANMKKNCSTFLGKDYDIYFGWSDEKIYCSELVWKVYKNSLDLALAKTQKLKEFDLKHPLVRQKLKDHYGNNIPYDEEVISPQAIFESDLLIEVVVD